VLGTVRREKTGRADSRRERAERKVSEKEKLRAEVRRLKNLKRQEITDKMAQIAKVGGLAGLDAVAAANLTDEFDPAGPARYRSPRHTTHFEPSFLELHGMK